MGIIVGDNGADFEPIPAGMHRAVCVNIFDVGVQPGYQGGPPMHKLVILWELEPRSDKTGKRFTVTKIYTKSINAMSNLGNDLESWRGRAFTDEERKGFDLDAILGKPCQINLVDGENGRVKIKAISPAAKQMDPVTQKMMTSQHWTPETQKDYVPNFVKKMIEQQIVTVKMGQAQSAPQGEDFTDDIPF